MYSNNINYINKVILILIINIKINLININITNYENYNGLF